MIDVAHVAIQIKGISDLQHQHPLLTNMIMEILFEELKMSHSMCPVQVKGKTTVTFADPMCLRNQRSRLK